MKVENGMIGKDVPFERIRRITGYLVGDINRFNDAKREEVKDRLKHKTGGAP
jgi:anaerobic ribonucleoside-triphosphate reductase